MPEVSERDATFYADGGWGYDDSEALVHIASIAKELPTGSSVLDAGCGDGTHAAAFSVLGFDVVGVDVSEDAIVTAKRKHPAVSFRCLDLEEPSDLGPFDVIYCRGITPYTGGSRDEASDRLFGNLRSLLSDDGLLLLERVTDGSGERGPSAYFPGQTRANPTVEDLTSLVEEWFLVRSVEKAPDGVLLVCEPR